MIHQLAFDVAHNYLSKSAITIPTKLWAGGVSAEVDAYLDTGSTFCIFKRDYAEVIGLEVESGTRLDIDTVTGVFTAYGHTLTLETLGLEFEATVYFAAHEGFTRNVLGRRGWLDRVRLGIVEYEGKLYMSRYED